MATFTIREGITDPITFTLKEIDPDTGVASAVDLTGVTKVDLRLRSRDGTDSMNFASTDASPQVAVSATPTDGQVTFTPADGDFNDAYQQYEGYFEVTDASGSLISFPSDENFTLVVIGEF